ncbi:hypothetical protein GCM10019059_18570 [Camelimonas fluminis]|nr:hypothetical protein GCM10019059_18570 [Camelimonas fluminis]
MTSILLTARITSRPASRLTSPGGAGAALLSIAIAVLPRWKGPVGPAADAVPAKSVFPEPAQVFGLAHFANEK